MLVKITFGERKTKPGFCKIRTKKYLDDDACKKLHMEREELKLVFVRKAIDRKIVFSVNE